jgi:glycosyltransferase involved in cell wall biosynthesis
VFLLERLPLRKLLAARIASGADELLFSSRALRGRFLALLSPIERGKVATRCHVCAMGIEPAVPRADRNVVREQLGVRGFTVMSLGRLIELKGIEHAIAAIARLPEAELVIAGAGPDRARLERLAGPHVRFVGELRGDDKSRWLQAADAFVLPSIVLPSGRSEGMPTTLLEAMEHGLPVVASDVGGVADVVKTGVNGVLVPPGDADAIARALSSLRDSRAGLVVGARETAAMYHWSELGPRLLELTLG